MPGPNTTTSIDNTQVRRQRTIRNAAALVASSVAKVFVAPGIQDSTRTVRSLIEDLRSGGSAIVPQSTVVDKCLTQPAVLQAPRANDAAIRDALARAGEIFNDIQAVGEMTKSLNITDVNSPAAHFRWQLQELSE
ncbi:hypothetical protein FS749_001531 [Ceratobasidium sp. UAMH 11750]|nr:hypothetical protein FS749_001531 [Ceratobasidium sp. UAMH 11750]